MGFDYKIIGDSSEMFRTEMSSLFIEAFNKTPLSQVNIVYSILDEPMTILLLRKIKYYMPSIDRGVNIFINKIMYCVSYPILGFYKTKAKKDVLRVLDVFISCLRWLFDYHASRGNPMVKVSLHEIDDIIEYYYYDKIQIRSLDTGFLEEEKPTKELKYVDFDYDITTDKILEWNGVPLPTPDYILIDKFRYISLYDVYKCSILSLEKPTTNNLYKMSEELKDILNVMYSMYPNIYYSSNEMDKEVLEDCPLLCAIRWLIMFHKSKGHILFGE